MLTHQNQTSQSISGLSSSTLGRKSSFVVICLVMDGGMTGIKTQRTLITDPTFTISSASLSDAGVYQCKAKRGDFSVDSETLRVQVQEPPEPKLLIESEWKTFYPTEKVTLKCSIDGGPNEWGYEWFENGARLSVDEDISFSGNTLSISSAKASHSGQYTCRGKHLKRTPVTTRQAEALQLDIYVDTPKPDIRKQRWFEFFYTEEKVQLGCNMSGDGWKYDCKERRLLSGQ
ncbi:low affinity immunoglobulin gamma Fc region receptor III-A-like [Megalobrama amblycephala]|uniref:low affinity immunoglobulin gamma Fc region receptor III-A-like n=1 Tax=Megalobrama amblycephala TaxID=75352 RepID=UPI002013DBC4|nr:low affinity immunoglobulin gamma Fc region receptor III-A-like [Megalobrama amblycephala]